MTWTKIRSDEDFPKEGQLVIGKYLLRGYIILSYQTDEGKSYWVVPDTGDYEDEPDFWQAFEL